MYYYREINTVVLDLIINLIVLLITQTSAPRKLVDTEFFECVNELELKLDYVFKVLIFSNTWMVVWKKENPDRNDSTCKGLFESAIGVVAEAVRVSKSPLKVLRYQNKSGSM